MKLLKHFFYSIIVLSFMGCSSGEKTFIKWVQQNQGKKLTPELMEDITKKFGAPTDTTRSSDIVIEDFNKALFLGPVYETEEGKKLYQEVNTGWNSFYTYWESYMNKTGEEQDLGESGFSSANEHWNEFTSAKDAFFEKYENIYNAKAKNQKVTLGEFFSSYQKKYPTLTINQCIDSIKNFGFAGIHESYIENLLVTNYSFLVEKSVSYKKFMEKNKENIKDFKINILNEFIVLGDGTIKESSGSSYIITDDSRKEFQKLVSDVDWVYKTGETLYGAIKFSKDGTYRYSTRMFGGISKQGQWWINNDGEIEATNQDSNIQITNSGLRIGETLYTKN